MSNVRLEMFLNALSELRGKTHGIRGICYYEILLNLYFDLGGRLPLSAKEQLKPTCFNETELEEILYILVSERVYQLINQEQFSEYLLINMMVSRVSQVLESGYQQLLVVENRKGAKGYRASKNATIKDFREGYEVQLWWEGIKEKVFKRHVRVISMEYTKLYYLLQGKVDYTFLKA